MLSLLSEGIYLLHYCGVRVPHKFHHDALVHFMVVVLHSVSLM